MKNAHATIGTLILEHPAHRYGVVSVRGLLGWTKVAALVREADDGNVYLMEVGGAFSRGNVARLVRELGALGRPVVGWGSPRNPIGRLLVEEGFALVPRDHRLEIRLFYERETPREGEMYYTIGEVSELTGVKPHVLRYWESEFPSLRPKKNRAGNRSYRPRDIKAVLAIRDLLYKEKFTINGARKNLQDNSGNPGEQSPHSKKNDKNNNDRTDAHIDEIILPNSMRLRKSLRTPKSSIYG